MSQSFPHPPPWVRSTPTELGNGGLFAPARQNNSLFGRPLASDAALTPLGTEWKPDLLQGPAIEIVVGPEPHASVADEREIWWLPIRLISHHSAFLRAACFHDFKEKKDNRISLVNEDPNDFKAFVSFMYYGRYTPSNGNERMHEIMWLFGDRLISVALQNYAMEQIHRRDMVLAKSTMSPQDFALVCNDTVEGSRLRQFSIDFLVSHFANTSRISGEIEEWDNILAEHDDVRMVMVKHMRSGNTTHHMKPRNYYMEGKNT